MRLHRLLPSLSLAGALFIALPAEAARLQFWRFDPQENRLTFTTDDSIQPTAQLLSNPTRLVIDLPGTTLATQLTLAKSRFEAKAHASGQYSSPKPLKHRPRANLSPAHLQAMTIRLQRRARRLQCPVEPAQVTKPVISSPIDR